MPTSSPISRRLDIIDKMLNDETTVHPAGCNCALKTRVARFHAHDCPYRSLCEIVAELRGSQSDGETKHE